jgi:pSer/pThr/pTyr-binding forkhead associated (FHA) protein
MPLRAAPIDLQLASRGQTEDLDAVDRPRAAADAANAPLAPGRYLLVEQGGETLRLALTRQVTHLGRGFAATLQLEDPGVSRRHAIVVQRRGGVRILDDRSANGTWVNGRRVFEQELRDGDVIVMGRAVLVYRELPAQAA